MRSRLLAGIAPHALTAFARAMIHLGLGDTDRTFEWLERALDERSSWLVSLDAEPLFDPIRSDPRFQSLVRRVGLPAGV